MKVTIIGAGNTGRGIGTRAIAGGTSSAVEVQQVVPEATPVVKAFNANSPTRWYKGKQPGSSWTS